MYTTANDTHKHTHTHYTAVFSAISGLYVQITKARGLSGNLKITIKRYPSCPVVENRSLGTDCFEIKTTISLLSPPWFSRNQYLIISDWRVMTLNEGVHISSNRSGGVEPVLQLGNVQVASRLASEGVC